MCNLCKKHTEYQEHLKNTENVEHTEHLKNTGSYLEYFNITEKQMQELFDVYYSKKRLNALEESLEKLVNIKSFDVDRNIFETGQEIDNDTLFVMRWIAGMKMQEVLSVLKFNLNDPNVQQDLSVDNIGSAQRWAKSVTGSDIHTNDEIMSGRYTKPVRLAKFPNENQDKNIPITKTVDITSCCAHHFLPYGTRLSEGAYAIISYIPNNYVLGISKLQRVADWVSRRPSIQEDLTRMLYDEVSKAAETEDVLVAIFNTKHTCELLRGAQSNDGDFSSIYYNGKFKDSKIRQEVLNASKR